MKLHLCAGTVYLDGYINCDHNGKLALINPVEKEINKTTIDKYFKYPFVVEKEKRVLRDFVIDCQMNILEKWPFQDNSMEEVVLVNALEHFEYNSGVPHIINEAYRVLKPNGVFKFDFPDLKGIIEKYHESDPEFCMALIYGTHKNIYSRHEWGYTPESIKLYFDPTQWVFEQKEVVNHDYPATGIWATKLDN